MVDAHGRVFAFHLDETVSDNRTEKPTPRRMRQARDEGQAFTRSQEVGIAFSLLGMVLSLRMLAPGVFERLADDTRHLLRAGSYPDPLAVVTERVGGMFATALIPFLITALVVGLVAGVSQTGVVFVPKAAKPRLKNLSLRRGLEKLKPSRALWDVARSAVKIGLLLAMSWATIDAWTAQVRSRAGFGESLAATAEQAWGLIGRVALLALAVAVGDYAINRYRTQKGLKMTRSDVKRDMKDSDGDPMVRMRRRRLAAEMSRNRMIGEVGYADVVVANPTHIAVALRYLPDDPAPRVVARGAGKFAERIKTTARRHGVMVTEDRPLARALFKACRPGQFIPADLYEAVAVVLAAAYRRRGWAA